jgi:hypothetical protein
VATTNALAYYKLALEKREDRFLYQKDLFLIQEFENGQFLRKKIEAVTYTVNLHLIKHSTRRESE